MSVNRDRRRNNVFQIAFSNIVNRIDLLMPLAALFCLIVIIKSRDDLPRTRLKFIKALFCRYTVLRVVLVRFQLGHERNKSRFAIYGIHRVPGTDREIRV